MNIKKILISQPTPSSAKSPYYDIEKRFDVELTFKPFVQIETYTVAEYRALHIPIQQFTAIVFTSRTAVQHFFKLAEGLRAKPSEDMHYFCLNDTIACYLQKFVVYHKRRVHHAKTGKVEDLIQSIKKHNEEKFLMPVAEDREYEKLNMGRTKVNIVYAPMYRSVSTVMTPDEIASYDMLVFFSPSGVNSLFDNNPEYQQGDQRIGVYGPLTAKAAEERQLRIDAQGPTPELQSMAAVLQKYLTDNKE